MSTQALKYPEYFAGSAGAATMETCLDYVQSVMRGERVRFPFESHYKHFEVGHFESDSFLQVATHPHAELNTFVGKPNFKNYYWAPENRGKVCSLVVMLRIGVKIRHVRVILVHESGRIVRVDNLGHPQTASDGSDVSPVVWLRHSLRQYVE